MAMSVIWTVMVAGAILCGAATGRLAEVTSAALEGASAGVELAVTMNIVAATNNISREQIRDLRATCVSEVKRTSGSYSLLDAYEMQRG